MELMYLHLSATCVKTRGIFDSFTSNDKGKSIDKICVNIVKDNIPDIRYIHT
jgi:hypothetical protein